jgi:D-sedoheptulose 7-phosphate isomerase
MTKDDFILAAFEQASATQSAFLADAEAVANVRRFVAAAAQALDRGNTLLSCGNGGSMCDAMHFAEEWTGRFRRDRVARPAIAFSDPSQLSCIANDYGYDEVFARLVEAHGRQGDVLVAISTSGNSANVVKAVELAAGRGITTVGLLGMGGGELARRVDIPIVVPHARTTDRIQELHIQILHAVIESVERQLHPENYA